MGRAKDTEGKRKKNFLLSLDAIHLVESQAKQYQMKQNEYLHHLLKQQLQYAPQNKQEENIKTMMKKLNEMDRDNKELKSQINQDSAAKIEGLIRANSKLENNISGLNEQIESLHKQMEDIEAQAIIEIEELQENNQRLLGMFSKSPKVQLHELTEEMEIYRVRAIEQEQISKACLKERTGLIAENEQLGEQLESLKSSLATANEHSKIYKDTLSFYCRKIIDNNTTIEELRELYYQQMEASKQIKNNNKGETA